MPNIVTYKITNEVIWNKFIRITHWLVAIIVILNLYILEEGDEAHRYTGYIVFGLVIIRIIYGLTGRTKLYSFAQFPLSLKNLKMFILNKISSENKISTDYPGHNPLASLVYIIIWSCILGLGITGWMMGIDQFFGEDWLNQIHDAFSTVLQLCILAHLAGMVLDAKQFKRKTWLGMITGKK